MAVKKETKTSISVDDSSKPVPTEKKESIGDDLPRVFNPSNFDVLFGRGKPYQGHAGNIRLHKVVDLYKPRYSQARRHEKTEIAEEIVQFIKNGGGKSGRFLKRIDNEEAWVEVSDNVARDKVSHALRGKPRKETNHVASPIVLDELLSAKRSVGGAGFTGPLGKRQKFTQFSDLEIMAAQRANSMNSVGMMLNGGFLGNAGNNFPASMQQQLFASAMAERQRAAAGLSPQVGSTGMGLLNQGTPVGLRNMPPVGGMSDVNPVILQQIAAERQLRAVAESRLWR